MLEAAILFAGFLFYLSLLGVVSGMIKPVTVLWFLPRFNRLLVIKIYGTLSLLFFFLYKLLDYLH